MKREYSDQMNLAKNRRYGWIYCRRGYDDEAFGGFHHIYLDRRAIKIWLRKLLFFKKRKQRSLLRLAYLLLGVMQHIFLLLPKILPVVFSFGEMLIDFVPDVAGVSLALSDGFVKAPGGAPANVAVAITKLGGKSAFVGKFGDDEFGHMLADILKRNGVNAEGVLFDQHARTALAFVTLKSNGEREFMFYWVMLHHVDT